MGRFRGEGTAGRVGGRPAETKNPEAVASGSGFPRDSEKTRPYDAAMAWREMRMPIVSAKGFMVRTSSTSGSMVRLGPGEVKRLRIVGLPSEAVRPARPRRSDGARTT